MSGNRVLTGVAVLAILAGVVLIGPTASATTAYSYGPYKSLADCRAVQAIVRPLADRLGACYAMPKRGYFFTAYED